jgi:hypothetical protein
MRTGRSVRSKNGMQASRSAEAVIRHGRVEPPGADPDRSQVIGTPEPTPGRQVRAGMPFFRP